MKTKENTKSEEKAKDTFVKAYATGRLSVSVFEHTIIKDNKPISFYKFSLQKSYKDKNDEWQKTSNLDASDLLPAAKLLEGAYAETAIKMREPSEED